MSVIDAQHTVGSDGAQAILQKLMFRSRSGEQTDRCSGRTGAGGHRHDAAAVARLGSDGVSTGSQRWAARQTGRRLQRVLRREAAVGHRPTAAGVSGAGRGRRGCDGRVLDAGCGTGEHALMARPVGSTQPASTSRRRRSRSPEQKARDRGLEVRFLVLDALELATLRRALRHRAGLRPVPRLRRRRPRPVRRQPGSGDRAGAWYHLLCFSDRQPGDWGPRRVTPRRDRVELRERLGDRLDRADRSSRPISSRPRCRAGSAVAAPDGL